MDDIIAVEVKDGKRGNAAFLTWGRVFDRIDPDIIENKIAAAAPRFGLHNIKSVQVCWSLQEVARYPYFYEALVAFSWKPIPFGKGYKAWAAKKRKEISAGKEIYFLGTIPKR